MSGPEIFVIIIVALLLFGADKLPEIAKTVGKGMRDFRKATDEIRREIETSTSDFRKDLTDVSESIKTDVSNYTEKINREANDVAQSINSDVNNIASEAKKNMDDMASTVNNYGATETPASDPEVKKENISNDFYKEVSE
jgi:sec-independent protein translocase protein TatA